MKKQDTPEIFHSQESNTPLNFPQTSRRKKKIKKQHRKKKSRVVVKTNVQQKSLIEEFVHQNESLFSQNRETLAQSCRQTIMSSCHVRHLLSKSEQDAFDIKQADCQQETWRYLAFLKAIQQSTFYKVGIFGKTGAFSVGFLRKEDDEGRALTTRNLRFLSSMEELLMHRRALVREQVRDYVQRTALGLGYNQIQLRDCELEILTLAKINNQLQNQIMEKISQSLGREDAMGNCQFTESDSFHLQEEYKKELIIKNLEKGFTEEPIDFLNYHKRMESYENNCFAQGEFTRIEDMASFRKYMSWRKPKLNKCSKNHLKTPCSACLSDFSEMSNPIIKCPECPIRIHKNCQRVENRCHRCRFSRTSNEEKSKTGYCYICERPREKGLMILTVTNSSPHYFAHNFCLLVHNLWHLQGGELRGQYAPLPKNQVCCRFCRKKGGIMLQCFCGESMHAMCGYLSGLSFWMQRTDRSSGSSYKVHLNCCQRQQKRHRLSLQRKFKLNYEKVIFRENEQLQEYILGSIAKQ